jgi:hypothetical protein
MMKISRRTDRHHWLRDYIRAKLSLYLALSYFTHN